MECATFKGTPSSLGIIFHLRQDDYVYMFPVPTLNGMVPPFHPKKTTICILFASFQSHNPTAFDLHPVCSI